MRTRAGFILLMLLLTACAPSLQVHTEYDPDYDVWTYTTFDWALPDSTVIRNPAYYTALNDRKIKAAVTREFLKRGYQQTNDHPEVLLRYHIVVEDKTAIAIEPFGYVYGTYGTRTQQNVYTYTQGTLIVDLIDTRIHQLIWRGWAESAVDGVTDPGEIEALINQAARRMLNDFPKRNRNRLKP